VKENKFKLIDSWSIAEVENNGCPIIIRFRSKLDILCGKAPECRVGTAHRQYPAEAITDRWLAPGR
jgi:hypothetical protein